MLVGKRCASLWWAVAFTVVAVAVSLVLPTRQPDQSPPSGEEQNTGRPIAQPMSRE